MKSALSMLSNWMKPTSAEADADDDRADVRNEVGDPGGDAPDRRVVEAERVEREAGGDADDDAGRELDQQVALDLLARPRRAPGS